MSTELAPRSAAINAWDGGFQKLVTTSILKPKYRDATAPELALFAEQCIRTGLDPMSKQIYGIYRKDNQSGGEERMTIQVGIDGLRAIAERTGRYGGSPAYLFCGPDKQWTDVWLESVKPVAAKAIVKKVVGGIVIETEAVALWSEYGATTNVWKTKPAHMIGKCAEALALRKAFPNDMSGLYTDDEMAAVDAPLTAAPVASLPPAASAAPPATEAPTDTTAVEDRGEDGLVAIAEQAVKDGMLTTQVISALLIGHGATDTTSVTAALRSMPDDGVQAFADALAQALEAGGHTDEQAPVAA